MGEEYKRIINTKKCLKCGIDFKYTKYRKHLCENCYNEEQPRIRKVRETRQKRFSDLPGFDLG